MSSLDKWPSAIFGKWQWVRLVDILFLGPFMMYLAKEIENDVDKWKADTLYFFGATTLLLNLYFYLKILFSTGAKI
jgi:hypothetical protein